MHNFSIQPRTQPNITILLLVTKPMYFPKRVLLPIIRSRFISKKKKKLLFRQLSILSSFKYPRSTKMICLDILILHFSSLEKWIARKLIAAPPQRDIRGFETSTAIKRIIAGGFFFSGWKREERKKRKKRKRNGLAFTGSRKSASIYTTRICTPREDTRERSRTP